MARSIAVSPSAFFTDWSTPAATSLATASAPPTVTANISAVHPSLSCAFRSTFFSMSCGVHGNRDGVEVERDVVRRGDLSRTTELSSKTHFASTVRATAVRSRANPAWSVTPEKNPTGFGADDADFPGPVRGTTAIGEFCHGGCDRGLATRWGDGIDAACGSVQSEHVGDVRSRARSCACAQRQS